MQITLRGEKGAPLTHEEMDGNFKALRGDCVLSSVEQFFGAQEAHTSKEGCFFYFDEATQETLLGATFLIEIEVGFAYRNMHNQLVAGCEKVSFPVVRGDGVYGQKWFFPNQHVFYGENMDMSDGNEGEVIFISVYALTASEHDPIGKLGFMVESASESVGIFCVSAKLRGHIPDDVALTFVNEMTVFSNEVLPS